MGDSRDGKSLASITVPEYQQQNWGDYWTQTVESEVADDWMTGANALLW